MNAKIFNRELLVAHKNNSFINDKDGFLFDEVSSRLLSCLTDVNLTYCNNILNLSTNQYLAHETEKLGKLVINSHIADKLLSRIDCSNKVVIDEEFIPVCSSVFDLIINVLSLHWVNDVLGSLLQIRESLTANGIFIAAIFSPDTLKELRVVLNELSFSKQYFRPRISPFIDMKTLASLVRRAGFSNNVISSEVIEVSYRNAETLFTDIRNMGESSKLLSRDGNAISEQDLQFIESKYQALFPDDEGGILVSFGINLLTAWK